MCGNQREAIPGLLLGVPPARSRGEGGGVARSTGSSRAHGRNGGRKARTTEQDDQELRGVTSPTLLIEGQRSASRPHSLDSSYASRRSRWNRTTSLIRRTGIVASLPAHR